MWWGLVRHRRAPISYPAEFYDGYEFRRQPFPRHPALTTAYPPPPICRFCFQARRFAPTIWQNAFFALFLPKITVLTLKNEIRCL